MKTSLLFDFIVDKTNNQVLVKREFDATKSLVWDAFTKAEILDQWWAPKPWNSKTKIMDFTPGGKRVYAMVSPEGDEHWSMQQYTEINSGKQFGYNDHFTDEAENINTAIPGSNWLLTFSEKDGKTIAEIRIQHQSLASLEQHISMGFQGGFTMTLNYLDELLRNLK